MKSPTICACVLLAAMTYPGVAAAQHGPRVAALIAASAGSPQPLALRSAAAMPPSDPVASMAPTLRVPGTAVQQPHPAGGPSELVEYCATLVLDGPVEFDVTHTFKSLQRGRAFRYAIPGMRKASRLYRVSVTVVDF